MDVREKEKPKQRGSTRKTKRWMSSVLAASLLLPTILIPGKNVVEGAGYANIVSKKVSTSVESTGGLFQTALTLSDGRVIKLRNTTADTVVEYNTGSSIPKSAGFGSFDETSFILGSDGVFNYKARSLYYDSGSGSNKNVNIDTKLGTNWVSVGYLNGQGPTPYTIIGVDAAGHTWGYGYGANGQMGTGVKQNTEFLMEVLDPDLFDTPISGIKKVIQISNSMLLLVSDTDVYFLGYASATLNSSTKALPVKITDKFPAFTSAADFEYARLGGEVTSGGAAMGSPLTLAYFKINGSYYTYTPLDEVRNYSKYVWKSSMVNGNYVTSTDLEYYNEGFGSLALVPTSEDLSKVDRKFTVRKYNEKSLSAGTWNTFFELNGGVLQTWGMPYKNVSALQETSYTTTKSTVLSSIKKYVYNPDINVSILAMLGTNGNVYVDGDNGADSTYLPGITGITGKISTPTKLTGTANEIKNITDIVFGGNNLYMLKDTNEIIIAARRTNTNDPYFKTLTDRKYVGLVTAPKTYFEDVAFGIGDDGNLYRLTSTGGILQTGATGIYPAGVTPEPTTIAQPTSSVAKDKFNNTVVTLTFPAEATKKEYSLDNGTTWNNYTAPVTVTAVGASKLLARSGTAKLYSDVLEVSFDNQPIVIPVGYPKILEQDGTLTVDLGAIDTSKVKVEIEVDGTKMDYTAPVQLQDGDHVVTVIVTNKDTGEELAKVTENVTVSPAAPGTITAPTGSVGSVNASNQRPLTLMFNPQLGSLQIQKDGGAWVEEADILNTYYGTVEDPSATERTYNLLMDNVDAVYKIRVVNGTTYSAETTLTVSTQVYDPTFSRDADDKLVIDFSNLPSGNYEKEYSLDNGATWEEYTGPIDVGGSLPIVVRVTDTDSGTVMLEKEYTTPALTGNGGTTPTDPNPPSDVDPSWGTEVTASAQEAILNVIGGALSSKFNGLLLDNIEIQTVKDYQTINSVTDTNLEDSRGTADGWTYTQSITDFVSDPVLDTKLNTQDLVVKIPASALSVDVKNAKVLAGMPEEVAKTGNYVLGETKQVLAQAEPLKGMGYYDVPMDYMLRVPSKVTVVSANGSSDHKAGDQVGLRVGVYRSLFTFSLASGI